MTMLELIDKLVELLRGQEIEGVGPLAVEKYRRLYCPDVPVVYVTPAAQSEKPVAIGGQFAERFSVELRCEVPWEGADSKLADALLQAVDRLVEVIENNRKIADARCGRIGEVTYALRQSPAGKHAFVATIPVEYISDKGQS